MNQPTLTRTRQKSITTKQTVLENYVQKTAIIYLTIIQVIDKNFPQHKIL